MILQASRGTKCNRMRMRMVLVFLAATLNSGELVQQLQNFKDDTFLTQDFTSKLLIKYEKRIRLSKMNVLS